MLKGDQLHHRKGMLLELIDESGATGLGEASPLPGFSSETLELAARQLDTFAHSLMDRELPESHESLDNAISRELDGAELCSSARFAVELSLWNIHALSQGQTLAEVMCPSPAALVPVNGLLSGSSDWVLAEGRRLREVGYEAVKLKVGGREVEEDAELVCELVEVLGEDVVLRLDANRAWSFAEAATFARAVAELRYEYVEEPLADPSGLADLTREHGVPVALDESLVGMAPEELVAHDYARAVVIKPSLAGGISRTLRFAEEARRWGITPVISSAYETGVGTAALVALAAATGGGKVAAGLDTYRRLGADVLDPPLEMTSPRVNVADVTGPGHKLQRSYLSVYASAGR